MKFDFFAIAFMLGLLCASCAPRDTAGPSEVKRQLEVCKLDVANYRVALELCEMKLKASCGEP